MGRSGGGGGGGHSGGGGSLGGGPKGHAGGGGSLGNRGRSRGVSGGNSFWGRTGGYSARPGGGFSNMGRSGGGFSGGGFGGGGGSLGGGPQGHAGGGGSLGSSGRSGGGYSGGGFGGGGGGSYGSGGFPPGGGNRRGPFFGGPMLFGGLGRAGCGTVIAVIVLVGILVFASMFSTVGESSAADSNGITESTYARQKIDGAGYENQVHDNLRWFSNSGSLANQLKHFYDMTGVQPVIVLENRPDLIGDPAAQEEEAHKLFQELGLSDGSFLFVYFDDNGQDGDWRTWVGNSAATVMDSEAIQIFGDYLNKYWSSNMNEDELFARTFNDTADRIMSRTTNSNDVAIWVWIAVGVIGAGIAIFFIAKQRRQHEAARAAETERILKADVKDITNDDDELLKKYQDQKK